MPKYINTDLTTSTTATYGDTSKTYLAGRYKAKTVGGKNVVSAALTNFQDLQTTSAVTPITSIFNVLTGRKFEIQNVTTNVPIIVLSTFDKDLGTWAVVGKITMTLGLGTHSYRGFDVDDSDTSNIKIFISSTVTTALCLGGTYYTWGVTLSDFTPAGNIIYTATSTNQKGVYFAQYTGQVGLNHVGTTSGGVAHGKHLNTIANKTKFFQQNGTAALPYVYGWDTSLGNPSISGTITNGIACQTTAYAGTSPSAYFSMGASSNGYSTTAPTAGAFECVILQNGSTNIPTNFTATPINTTQTLYYIRDLQLVSGVWYFNLATTATGAAVVPATNSATFSMMRGAGITTTHSLLKHGPILPVLSGTILQLHSFGATVPTSVPALPALNGLDCLFMGSTTNLYMFPISDLSDGGTTLSNLSGVNLIGTGVDYTAITNATSRYSSYLDRWIILTNTTKFVLKPHQNNMINKVFGALSNLYYEGQGYTSVQLGAVVIGSLNINGGWLFLAGTTAGQRGIVAADIYSDDYFGNSYLITKILHVPPGSKLRFFTTDEASASFTGDATIYIRSATTATDPIFSSVSSGWTQYQPYNDESPALIGPYFQVKLGSVILADNVAASPIQLHDFIIAYDEPGEIDKNFSWCTERTSKSGDSPMIVSVRQVSALISSPTKFLLVGTDDAGNTVKTIDSSIDAASFACSLNNGTSYGSFTNMANFMSTYNSSSGTTEIKITINSPPNPLTTPYVTWSFYYV